MTMKSRHLFMLLWAAG